MRAPSALLLASVVLSSCAQRDVATADDAGAVAAATVSAPPAPSPPPTPFDLINAQRTYAGAMGVASPHMQDETNDISEGSAMIGLWMVKHGKWSDVAVAKDETSFARVQKDSEAERGKRLCVSGQVIQIATKKENGAGKYYSGLLMTGSGNLFNYIAVGSSGDLVEHSSTRFCGAVTERYMYSNSAGGTGHAVTVVGMFDLPENRAVAAR